MKNIKKYLCAIVMMVISMTAFAQEDVFSGDWLGANKEGDGGQSYGGRQKIETCNAYGGGESLRA